MMNPQFCYFMIAIVNDNVMGVFLLFSGILLHWTIFSQKTTKSFISIRDTGKKI